MVIQNTTFGGIQGFTRKPSTPWFDDQGQFAGIVHQERNLTFVLVEGAGHLVPQQQPGRVSLYHLPCHKNSPWWYWIPYDRRRLFSSENSSSEIIKLGCLWIIVEVSPSWEVKAQAFMPTGFYRVSPASLLEPVLHNLRSLSRLPLLRRGKSSLRRRFLTSARLMIATGALEVLRIVVWDWRVASVELLDCYALPFLFGYCNVCLLNAWLCCCCSWCMITDCLWMTSALYPIRYYPVYVNVWCIAIFLTSS